jgi:hypothetical protein
VPHAENTPFRAPLATDRLTKPGMEAAASRQRTIPATSAAWTRKALHVVVRHAGPEYEDPLVPKGG